MDPKTNEPAVLEYAESSPTIDEILEDYLRIEASRVNVFQECVKDGQVTIETEVQASEIARLLNSAESELEDVKAMARAMVERAERRVNSLGFLFRTALEIWTSARLVGKKMRSLLLPGGKLSLRKVPESTRYIDDKATLAWAQQNLPQAIEMVPRIKLEIVKEWEAANKKAAPGRELTPEHDSFSVSVPKKT